ncbi:MAG: ABC transporter ATP-binding protein [Candidatus Fermentibacteraceae bacterium]|nr:ABC transporter ATP-binding protein [Candidatus Fermentibacteraceae bacterium]MBN2609417.1 ABC transporter ATP-binding protein [Candidatus Fermentibacteraceae bacterium]
MNEDVIVTEGVEKTYEDSGVPVPAVRGIDYRLARGEFTAIIGPSGSGKTTFLNLIAGLDTPTSGKVWLSGRCISDMSGRDLSDFRRDNIGFIFQAYNLLPVLTVEENVEYIMLLQGVPKPERHERVMDILEKVGLAGYRDRRPLRLSGGQQQRVAVARAMVSNPSLVIADEPTANLDSQTSGELLDMMRRLNEETGMTFLFSTHDEIVMERARKVVVLRDGRIDGNADPEDFQ